MDLATLVPLALQASIMLMVASLGLRARPGDLVSLFRQPSLLARSLLSMNFVMPFVAVAIALNFNLPPAVKIAMVALSLSPVPPLLPGKQLDQGGNEAYVYGLLVSESIVAVAFIPIALKGLELVFPVALHLEPVRVLQIVLLSVLGPLLAGVAFKRLAPELAARVAKPLPHVATALLAIPAVLVLVKVLPQTLALIGDGTLVAFAAFIVAGLVVGHVFGGPDGAERTVLALATSSRHPGIALAIASANFPDQKLVLPSVLLYAILGMILSIAYARWRRAAVARREARAAARAAR